MLSSNKTQAYLFLLPAVLIFSIFMYWPLLENIYLSFFQWNMISPTMKFVGLDNYINVFTGNEFFKILINTALYIICLLVLNFLLPYIYSFVLGHIVQRYTLFYRSVLFVPSNLSLSVAAIIFLWLYNPLAGPISLILSIFNLETPRLFKENILVIFAISSIIGWKVFGYNLIVMLAAMSSVPKDIIEAAKIENASNWQLFRHIILPLTSPTALYVFTITVVFGLQYVLVPVNMLTQGGPDQGSTNLVYIIYQYAFTFFQTGPAAAFSVITMIFYAAFLVLKTKVLEKKVHYEN